MKPTAALVLETHNLRGGDTPSRAVESLERLLRHLRGQTLAPSELGECAITHQGPAPDRARMEAAAGRPLTFVELPVEADYYQAKNAGFDATTAERVVFGDSDCWPDAGWLEALLAPLQNPAVAAVAGRTCYRPDVLGAAATAIDFNYYPSPLGPDCTRNFYANNVAFRRDVFQAHRYAEGGHFYRGNCQTLGLRLQAAGVAVRFEPKARTTHRLPDTWREWVQLRMLRGGDLVELSREVLRAYVPPARAWPRPIASAAVLGARVGFSLGALGRQDMPRLGMRWPLAALGMMGISMLDGIGAVARLAGAPALADARLSYHADVDRLAA